MDQTREQPLIYLRWALIASLVYMILLGESGPIADPTHLTYVGLLLASNLIIPRIPYRNPQTFGAVLLGLDTLFVLVGVLLCNTTSQDLLIGYFLCIVMASFGNSERSIAGAAVLVTGMYSLWLFQNLDAINRPSLLIRLPFLFVTTVFYGYMMQRVRGEHTSRLRAEAQARSLDCLLQVTRSFSSSLASQEVLERVAETIRNTLHVERCRIQLVPGDGAEPISPAVAEALEQRRPVMHTAEGSEERSFSILALPILYGVEPLGVLLVEAERSGKTFSGEEIEFCQVIANAAASALKNARQYESLVEIERAKSEFLANLSHELRTPLSAIIGYSELATEQCPEHRDPETSELLTHIHRSAMEMGRHVDNLLRLSQVTLGRERKEVGRVNLPAVLGQALEGVQRLARHGQIQFGLEIDPQIGEIYTDGEKLQRIVEYILLNAVKFTERGSVRVSAALVHSDDPSQNLRLPNGIQPWERLLALSIEDTGIGIDRADLSKIFQDFRQANGSINRQFAGLGIGLAVSRRLAEILGGAIRVKSRPGEGSVFQVLVPVQVGVAA